MDRPPLLPPSPSFPLSSPPPVVLGDQSVLLVQRPRNHHCSPCGVRVCHFVCVSRALSLRVACVCLLALLGFTCFLCPRYANVHLAHIDGLARIHVSASQVSAFVVVVRDDGAPYNHTQQWATTVHDSTEKKMRNLLPSSTRARTRDVLGRVRNQQVAVIATAAILQTRGGCPLPRGKPKPRRPNRTCQLVGEASRGICAPIRCRKPRKNRGAGGNLLHQGVLARRRRLAVRRRRRVGMRGRCRALCHAPRGGAGSWCSGSLANHRAVRAGRRLSLIHI